jgi:hypothetical protein
MILKRIAEFISGALSVSHRPEPAQINSVNRFEGRQGDRASEHKYKSMQHIERLIRTTAAASSDDIRQWINEKSFVIDNVVQPGHEGAEAKQPVKNIIKNDRRPVSLDNPFDSEEIQAIAVMARRLKTKNCNKLHESSVV